MPETTTTVKKPRKMMEMFTDATVGESYANNRLVTTTNDAGNVVLIAYGHHVIGEYDESEGTIVTYLGHKGISQTLTRWINQLVEVSTERRDNVILSPEEPTVGRPADSVKYIGNYINFNNMSAVERDALQSVIESLKFARRFL